MEIYPTSHFVRERERERERKREKEREKERERDRERERELFCVFQGFFPSFLSDFFSFLQ